MTLSLYFGGYCRPGVHRDPFKDYVLKMNSSEVALEFQVYRHNFLIPLWAEIYQKSERLFYDLCGGMVKGCSRLPWLG